jgi:hypothetical protein
MFPLRYAKVDRSLISASVLAILSLSLSTSVAAQERQDWNSLGRISPGEKVSLSARDNHHVTGAFQSWTPDKVNIANVTVNRQDVLKIERLRTGRGRGKRAAIGALIGFGAGFGIGAAAGGNCGAGHIGPCISRGELGGVLGACLAAAGALVGGVLPNHGRELIYAGK